MVRQRVLKTRGGKTFAGSNPVPSASLRMMGGWLRGSHPIMSGTTYLPPVVLPN